MLMYFLPAIMILGLITSYEDIKFGKIRNKWIIAALAYFAILNVFLISGSYIRGVLNTQYIIELLTNLFFSIMVGFGFWYLRIWTAGDGKLFIAYSALIPFTVYQHSYEKWIPSVSLLLNIFILGFFLILMNIVRKVRLRDIKKIQLTFLKKIIQPRELFTSIIYLFVIYWVAGGILFMAGLHSNYFLRMFLTILIMIGFVKRLGKNAVYVMLAISLLRLLIDKSIYSIVFLRNLLILIIVWQLLKKIILEGISALDEIAFFEEKKVNALKPGMLLGDIIKRQKKMNKKEFKLLKKQRNVSIIKKGNFYYIKKPRSNLDVDNFIDEEAEGLTKVQINKIKKVGFNKVRVAKTIPFAPLMFLGVIFTLIAKGNILILIKILF